MLEVHPPHHAVHTRKDFFIHILAIVIGLLIAVGIEQTVEYVHHRNQVAETRNALHEELEHNYKRFTDETIFCRREIAGLQNNLLVLDYIAHHPHSRQQDLPGVLAWGHFSPNLLHAAWDAANQNGITARMDPREVADNVRMYRLFNLVQVSNDNVWNAIVEARQFDFTDPDPTHLDPAQLHELDQHVRLALMEEYKRAVALYDVKQIFPSFPNTFDRAELDTIHHVALTASDESLTTPRDLTNRRLLSASGNTVPTFGPDGPTNVPAPAPTTK